MSYIFENQDLRQTVANSEVLVEIASANIIRHNMVLEAYIYENLDQFTFDSSEIADIYENVRNFVIGENTALYSQLSEILADTQLSAEEKAYCLQEGTVENALDQTAAGYHKLTNTIANSGAMDATVKGVRSAQAMAVKGMEQSPHTMGAIGKGIDAGKGAYNDAVSATSRGMEHVANSYKSHGGVTGLATDAYKGAVSGVARGMEQSPHTMGLYHKAVASTAKGIESGVNKVYQTAENTPSAIKSAFPRTDQVPVHVAPAATQSQLATGHLHGLKDIAMNHINSHQAAYGAGGALAGALGAYGAYRAIKHARKPKD